MMKVSRREIPTSCDTAYNFTVEISTKLLTMA